MLRLANATCVWLIGNPVPVSARAEDEKDEPACHSRRALCSRFHGPHHAFRMARNAISGRTSALTFTESSHPFANPEKSNRSSITRARAARALAGHFLSNIGVGRAIRNMLVMQLVKAARKNSPHRTSGRMGIHGSSARKLGPGRYSAMAVSWFWTVLDGIRLA